MENDLGPALLTGAEVLTGLRRLVYGLGEAASYGWGSSQAAGSLAAAAVLPGVFMACQAGRPDPLLPLRTSTKP